MYKPLSKLTAELVNYVFAECVFWSVLSEVKWLLALNVDKDLDPSFLKNFVQKNPGIVFIYFHKTKTNNFLLVAYDTNKPVRDLYKSLNFPFIEAWREVFEKLTSFSFLECDLNESVLVWDANHQQCVAEYIDCMNGGLVFDLPKNFNAVWKNGWEEAFISKRMDKNFKIYKKWEKITPNNQSNIDFAVWFEQNTT